MVLDNTSYIKLSIGEQKEKVLKYPTSKEATQFPPIIFDKESKPEKKYDQKFYFLLTEHGLEIGDNQGRKLCSQNGEVSKASAQNVMWYDETFDTFKQTKSGFWQLIKAEKTECIDPNGQADEDDFFMIGMNYGDTFPRIVSKQRDKLGQFQIQVSTRWKDKIYEPDVTHWKLEIIDENVSP